MSTVMRRGTGEPYEGSPSMKSELGDRNRRLRRVLLVIVAALVVASFLVGIRW